MTRHHRRIAFDLDLMALAIQRRMEARQRAAAWARVFLATSGAVALCAALWAAAPDHRLTRPVKLVAVDSHGESWIAGSGDDCTAAMINAVLPADVATLVCQDR